MLGATNRNLKKEVEESRFREGLYYRLNIKEIHIPPLRERPQDIPLLVDHLIKKHNPEMTDDLIAFSVAKMREYGIVDSGDSLKLGVGVVTEARVKSFFDKMVKAGLFKADLDYKKSYTLQFVNKGVGLDIKPKQ